MLPTLSFEQLLIPPKIARTANRNHENIVRNYSWEEMIAITIVNCKSTKTKAKIYVITLVIHNDILKKEPRW